MELLIASLLNTIVNCCWMSALFGSLPVGGRARNAEAGESSLVAESNRDLAALVAGTMTHAEFTIRNDARRVAIKAKL